MNDPFADVQATGTAVLNVLNARVNESLKENDDLRVFVMIRDLTTQEFTLMEYGAACYDPQEYVWTLNKDKNFIGREVRTGEHVFT